MVSLRGLSSLAKGMLTVLAALLLLAPVIAAPASLLPPLAAALVVVGLSILLYVRVVGSDDEGGGSVWNAIPSRQYNGRHVESGGLARGEQEAAIEEIQENAADRDRKG